jgi:hypothetical protein
MRRWIYLFGIFFLAAAIAVIASRQFRRENYEQRLHRVRPGMTFEEMCQIMEGWPFDPTGVHHDNDGLLPGEVGYIKWGVKRNGQEQWSEIRIYVDKNERVTRRMIAGEELETP